MGCPRESRKISRIAEPNHRVVDETHTGPSKRLLLLPCKQYFQKWEFPEAADKAEGGAANQLDEAFKRGLGKKYRGACLSDGEAISHSSSRDKPRGSRIKQWKRMARGE